MTTPLPTPSKSPTAEGTRLDLGNFFQPSASRPGANSSKPDFESLLSQRPPQRQTEEAREEREAAKARKKPIEIALTAPPLQENPTPRPVSPDLSPVSPENRPAAPADNESASSPEARTQSQTVSKPSPQESEESPNDQSQPETTPTDLEAPIPVPVDPEAADVSDSTLEENSEPSAEPVEQKPLSEETPSEARNDKLSSEEDANGMEPAPLDSEMISLATLEGIESSSAALREPSITSSHRLTAFAATDRNGLAPIGGAGGSSESGLGQLATGSTVPIEARQLASPSPAAQASSLLKSLTPELEKFRQTSRSQMQLDLPVGENETVRIRLSLRAGELHSTFITDSPELREALQKAWPEFAQASRDRGFRLGDPNFQQSFQGNDTAFGQNKRRDGTGQSESSTPAGVPSARKSAPAPTSSNQSSTALWA